MEKRNPKRPAGGYNLDTARADRFACPYYRPLNVPTRKSAPHKWRFPSRIRPNTFTWRSSPTAVARVKGAVAEITAVSRKDRASAAEGAIRLIERLSPALEHVNSSSGALGSAVNRAIETLAPIISAADVPIAVREEWLERLDAALAADDVPYIESLADYWGELCVTPQLASTWADRMVDITRMALSPDKNLRGHYYGTSACLSALLRAGRYQEIHSLLAHTDFWSYKLYAVKALAGDGKPDEAIALAESLRGPRTPDRHVDLVCEQILLDAGRIDEAYRRFALTSHQSGTYLATFRAVAQAYPSVAGEQILRDLIRQSPGEEGKWFAAAKELGLYDLALQLVQDSPCDPKTLARAARDHTERDPEFAVGAALAALRWLTLGYGYEITALEVWTAYHAARKAAETLGQATEIQTMIRGLLASAQPDTFVRQVLGRELELI